MTNRKFSVLVRSVAIAVVLTLCSTIFVHASPQSSVEAGPQTITDATPHRLLSHIVLGHLQELYGVPISFEDTWDVTDPKSEQRSITYTFTPPPPDADYATCKRMAGEVLADVVQKYNKLRGAEIYRIIDADNGFHVVATKFFDASGNIEYFQPLLDTSITLPPGQRTGRDILNEISKQLADARGQDPSDFDFVFRGSTGPTSLGRVVNITANNEPARSVLDRLFSELQMTTTKKVPSRGDNAYDVVPVGWSWELLSNPNGGKGATSAHMYIVKPCGAE